jgi:hypothetical protein
MGSNSSDLSEGQVSELPPLPLECSAAKGGHMLRCTRRLDNVSDAGRRSPERRVEAEM